MLIEKDIDIDWRAEALLEERRVPLLERINKCLQSGMTGAQLIKWAEERDIPGHIIGWLPENFRSYYSGYSAEAIAKDIIKMAQHRNLVRRVAIGQAYGASGLAREVAGNDSLILHPRGCPASYSDARSAWEVRL